MATAGGGAGEGEGGDGGGGDGAGAGGGGDGDGAGDGLGDGGGGLGNGGGEGGLGDCDPALPYGVTSARTRKRPLPGRSTVTTEPVSGVVHVTVMLVASSAAVASLHFVMPAPLEGAPAVSPTHTSKLLRKR